MTYAITRFMSAPTALNLLNIGAEINPSLAITRPDKDITNNAYRNFGGIGLLARPDELDPSKNNIYLHDSFTVDSPEIKAITDENGKRIGYQSKKTALDEASLRKYNDKQSNRPFWMRKLNNWNSRLTDYDEMAAQLNQYLISATGKKPSWKNAQDDVIQALKKQFRGNPYIEDYILTGNNYSKDMYPEEKLPLKEALEKINTLIRNPDKNAEPPLRSAAAALAKKKSDYSEIKVNGLRNPTHYIGAIYPEYDENAPNPVMDNLAWRFINPAERKRIIEGLKDFYGDKAIPYKTSLSVSERDINARGMDNRQLALLELMKKAGLKYERLGIDPKGYYNK